MREQVSHAVRDGMRVHKVGLGRLAQMIGLAPAALAELLRCEAPWSVDVMHRVATALGTSVWSLIPGDSLTQLGPQSARRPSEQAGHGV